MKSWRTTTLGILTVLVAVAGAAKAFIANGTIPDVTLLVTQIAAGIGLISARDNKVTSEDAGAK